VGIACPERRDFEALVRFESLLVQYLQRITIYVDTRDRSLGTPDLRERMAPRPAAMPRARYRKSLQLQLLSAASERLGVPPRAFLL